MVRRAASGVLFAGVLAASCSPAATGSAPKVAPASTKEAPKPAEIVQTMTDRYSRARTYEDKGTLVATMLPEDGNPSLSTIRFETAFDRARGGYFFDYRETHDRFFGPTRGVIWRQTHGPVRVFWTTRPPVEEKDLLQAIAGFTGVSGGTAHRIPSLLLGIGRGYRGLAFSMEGNETINGVSCVKLVERKKDSEMALWIGTADHALHRTFERTHFPPETKSDAEILAEIPTEYSEEERQKMLEALRYRSAFVSEATTDYDPVFDADVPESRFEFTPPS